MTTGSAADSLSPYRGLPPDLTDRIPPGQTLAIDWPVLTYALTPQTPDSAWHVVVDGMVTEARSWSLAELRTLPAESVTMDIHCVTGWSKLDMRFYGVPVRRLLDQVGIPPEAKYALIEAYDDCSTNLPLSHVMEDAWLVWAANGEPLDAVHGGPLRLVTRGKYFWKSLKWVNRISLLAEDSPGYWERLGYHNDADPWREQRSAYDEEWQRAVVIESHDETPTLRTLTLGIAGWESHNPGQHIKIVAGHGDSRFFRLYSIGSAPGTGRLQITVDRRDDGLVSPGSTGFALGTPSTSPARTAHVTSSSRATTRCSSAAGRASFR